MKKVMLAAVLAAAAFGNAYASEGALDALKTAAPAAALENMGAFPDAVIAKIEKSTGSVSSAQELSPLMIIKRYPAGLTSDGVMAECYLCLEAGALTATYDKGEFGYIVTSTWKRFGGDSKIVPIIEMYPRSLYTLENIMAEGYLRTEAGAKNVDVVSDSTYISLSSDWPVWGR